MTRIAAGALAALIVTLSLFALSPPPAQAHHEEVVWSARFTPVDYGGGYYGCWTSASVSHNAFCNNVFPGNNFFEWKGVRYTFLHLLFPKAGVDDGLAWRVTKSTDGSSTYNWPEELHTRVTINGVSVPLSNYAYITDDDYLALGLPRWNARTPVTVTIHHPDSDSPETLAQLQLERRGATRTGTVGSRCGPPDVSRSTVEDAAKVAEGGDNGHWHCHGDLVHQHYNWRARHSSPHQTIRATGQFVNTSVPRANTAAEKSQGFTDGWHWHGPRNDPSSIFHTHGGGGGSAAHPTEGQTVRPTGDRFVRPAATAPTAAERADGLGGWHWHGDTLYHQHDAGGQHPVP